MSGDPEQPPSLWPFVTIVFGVSYGLQGVVWLAGGVGTPVFERLAPVIMFVPGLTALALLARRRGGLRSIRWGPGRPAYILYAAVIPAFMALALVIALTRLGLAESPHIHAATAGVDVERGMFVLGKGVQSIPFFLLNLVVSSVVVGCLNGLVTVGEEVGWRGYLQPRLLDRLRLAPAIALVGLIWAHWHTPVILMGFNYPETPVLAALFLWPATCIGWSFLAAWVTINGESIWPAVVLHGSANAFLGGMVDGMTYRGPRLSADLISVGAWLLVAAAAYAMTRKPGPAREARPSMVVFQDADGRNLTLEELKGVEGWVPFEVMVAGKIPAEARALHERARKIGASGDHRGSMTLLDEAARLAPDWPYPAYDRAFAHLLLGEFSAALEWYKKTVELSPRGFFTALTAVDVLTREQAGEFPAGTYRAYLSVEWINDPAERAALLRTLVGRFPRLAPAWRDLSSLINEPEERLAAIERGLACDPDAETRGRLQIDKALILDGRGMHEAAMAILGELALDPRSTLATEHMAKVAMAMSRDARRKGDAREDDPNGRPAVS